MYCPECKCEYQGWNQKCPVCQTVLLETKPPEIQTDAKPIPYGELVDTLRETGGSITFDLTTTGIETKRRRSFPYIGRGYAWAKEMTGIHDQLTIKLNTTEVGRSRSWQFPYFGYGFAWEKEMEGNVGGNPLTLKADQVSRERKMAFPYLGYGRAWVQSMSGECGKEIRVHLQVTEVGQRKQHSFPYFGFGYAWVKAAQLKLSLSE
jgi:hypothetical protein